MTRLWILTALLLALAVAGCGPDCDKYCNKVQQCRTLCSPTQPVDVPACVTACNDASSGLGNTIQCVIDHTCADIAGGHCNATGDRLPVSCP